MTLFGYKITLYRDTITKHDEDSPYVWMYTLRVEKIRYN